MRAQKITFVWQSMSRHTVNTLQWMATDRTPEIAWNRAKAHLEAIRPGCDPELLLVFKGLPEVLDQWKPFRKPTKKEIDQLFDQ